MSVVSTFRSLAFLTLITCGVITAAWSGLNTTSWAHDRDRGDVVWINTAGR